MLKSYVGYFLLVLGTLIGCEPQFGPTGSNGDHPHFRSDYFSELPIEAYPDSGVYYTYHFTDYQERIEQFVFLVDTLIDMGYPITSAWYRAGERCPPVTGNFVTATVYRPSFMVRMDSANSRIEEFNFVLWGSGIPKICPYGVTVFTVHD